MEYATEQTKTNTKPQSRNTRDNGIGHVWLCDNNCPPPPPPCLLHTYDTSGGSGRFSDTPSVTLSGWRRTSDPLGT